MVYISTISIARCLSRKCHNILTARSSLLSEISDMPEVIYITMGEQIDQLNNVGEEDPKWTGVIDCDFVENWRRSAQYGTDDSFWCRYESGKKCPL